MRLTELAQAIVLSGVYWLLFAFMSGYAMIGMPDWWYPTFGENAVSAVTWMQISHSLCVISGAFPVAYVVVKFFPQTMLRISLLTASFAGVVMLVHVIRVHLYSAKFPSSANEAIHLVSSILDVVKIPLLLLVIVWIISRVLPPNNSLDLSS